MSAYELQELVRKWQREELTAEQMIGQLLLHLQRLSQRVGRLEALQQKGRGKEE